MGMLTYLAFSQLLSKLMSCKAVPRGFIPESQDSSFALRLRKIQIEAKKNVPSVDIWVQSSQSSGPLPLPAWDTGLKTNESLCSGFQTTGGSKTKNTTLNKGEIYSVIREL